MFSLYHRVSPHAVGMLLIDKTTFLPSCLAVSAGGRWVACYLKHDVISLWNPSNETVPRSWVALDIDITRNRRSITFSPDGRQLLALCSRQTFVWNVEDGGRVIAGTQARAFIAVAWSPGFIATVSEIGTISLWRASSSQPPAPCFRVAVI